MQLSTLFLMFATTLLPLVSGEACLAGGPADQVTAANTCCRELTGTWCGTEANQGIRVLPDWATFWWELCVLEIPGSVGLLDTRCIPGDGAGLTFGDSSSTMTSMRDLPTLTLALGV